ncbi:MAG TPA: DUF3341 domain-containing protein [Azospirillum sp.]|nr:DUF3341 domain-containing protein [Azospirillum sp.]
MTARPPAYGLIAQFDSADRLVAAARVLHRAGYRRIDGFSPVPVEDLAPYLPGEAGRRWLLPLAALAGALALGGGGYALQVWTSAVDYPLNVGGRPLHSWPSFLPATIILGILGAAVAAVLTMFALNRLPEPYHPLFNDPRFHRASGDAYFLCVESADPLFEARRTRRALEDLRPDRVAEVPW